MNWIGGTGHISTSTYNPAPPDTVIECLEQTMSCMRCEGMQAVAQSPITRMAVAHADFEAVHPFSGGNGRVGRLLLLLMMMAAEGGVPHRYLGNGIFLMDCAQSNRRRRFRLMSTAMSPSRLMPVVCPIWTIALKLP